MTLTSRQQTIQNQIDALDSSASTGSMLSLLNRAIDEGGIRWGYDSESLFPGYDSADLDSDYIGMFAFHDGDSDLWFHGQDLQWHKIDSASAAPSGPAVVWQASSYGYRSGGDVGSYAARNDIQKYSLTSDGNGTDVGDLNAARSHVNGGSSTTHGYAMGGTTSGSGFNGDYTQNIQKWTFASDANASAITATLTANRVAGSRGEISDTTHANIYLAGGFTGSTSPVASSPPPDAARVATIDKFDVSSDTTNATDQGDITEARYHLAGHSSSTHGYVSGGRPAAAVPGVNTIEKFPFAATANATDVGDLTVARRGGGGTSSTESGYHAGAYQYHPDQSTIDKFPFASDANATDVGDVNGSYHTQHATTASSTTHGYNAGVAQFSSGNIIEKFPFAVDENSGDVGDLPVSWWAAGSSAQV